MGGQGEGALPVAAGLDDDPPGAAWQADPLGLRRRVGGRVIDGGADGAEVGVAASVDLEDMPAAAPRVTGKATLDKVISTTLLQGR